ncbi:MAG: hypothetical protein ACLFUP_04125 [Desulfobacteraceae bacterium]
MKWDVFSGRNRGRRDPRLEEIQELEKRIEKFAPRRYSRERAVRYYYYRMMPEYVGPLLELLRELAHKERMAEDEAEAARTLFLRLKDFYDVKGRLSLEEALEDSRLRRNFSHLMLVFYGRETYDPCWRAKA